MNKESFVGGDTDLVSPHQMNAMTPKVLLVKLRSRDVAINCKNASSVINTDQYISAKSSMSHVEKLQKRNSCRCLRNFRDVLTH